MGGEETNVQFNCTIHRVHPVDVATLWYREEPDGSWFRMFSSDYAWVSEDKYNIEGTHNLVIKNVEASDARGYNCRNAYAGHKLAIVIVQLIVLGE